MCEFSEKLIAWLDRELPAENAANVARHVDICAECRNHLDVYRRVSETIDAYCDARLASSVERRSNPLAGRLAYTAIALAAAAALFFFLARPDEHLRSRFSAAPDGSPAIAQKAPVVAAPNVEKMPPAASASLRKPKRIKTEPLRRTPAPLTAWPSRNANWLPSEAPVYIAIPADALFPPGAFPEGVGFVADVNWRPDGSAQRLRLQPQLIGFETRGTRP